MAIKYRQEVVPGLKQSRGYKNSLEVPRLEKIVISMGLAAGLGYVYSLTIPPVYRAETTVLVGRLQENPNPNANID